MPGHPPRARWTFRRRHSAGRSADSSSSWSAAAGSSSAADEARPECRAPLVRPQRRLVSAGVALVAAPALAVSVVAHAPPQASDPSPGADLASAPGRVSITFGERPDPTLSTIRVLDTHGASVTAGPTTADPADPLRLSIPLAPLPNGVYTVAWRTVSAVDGHLATGSFAFGVGAAPPPPGTGAASSGSAVVGASPAAVAGRWLLYLGL